jgi:hypothetical protein
MDKKSAYQFFKDLQAYLNQEIPSPKMLREEIGIVVREQEHQKRDIIRLFQKGLF